MIIEVSENHRSDDDTKINGPRFPLLFRARLAFSLMRGDPVLEDALQFGIGATHVHHPELRTDALSQLADVGKLYPLVGQRALAGFASSSDPAERLAAVEEIESNFGKYLNAPEVLADLCRDADESVSSWARSLLKRWDQVQKRHDP